MIKVIVFDCGGVILSNDWDDPQFYAIPKLLGISWNKATKIFYKHYDSKLKFGKGSEDEFYKDLIKASKKNISVKKLRKFYRSLVKKEPAFSMAKKLSRKYPLYIMNNGVKEWMNLRIKKFHLKKYFEGFVCSAYVGYTKPDKRIYEIMLKKVKVKPKEIVFIDDRKENVKRARELGINAILFRGVKQLEKELLRLGVQID